MAFARHAGAARFAWNWGLARKQEERAAGRANPSAIDLHREINRLKGKPKETGGIPWAHEVSKCAFQESLRDLDAAFPVVALAQEGPAEVDIDLGVRKLAVLSDGTVYENPRALQQAAAKLRRAQKALSRSQRGSARRKKAARKVGRIHGRVANVRKDAIHKATTEIAGRFRVVAVEDLKVRNMTRSAAGTLEKPGARVRQKAGLNRSILDAGFGEFRRQLDYKLAARGGRLVAVPAPYTSQRCCVCGSITDPGSAEVYACAVCGLRMDRDLNAARNIVAAASWPEAQNARGAGVRPDSACTAGQSASKRERNEAISHG